MIVNQAHAKLTTAVAGGQDVLSHPLIRRSISNYISGKKKELPKKRADYVYNENRNVTEILQSNIIHNHFIRAVEPGMELELQLVLDVTLGSALEARPLC